MFGRSGRGVAESKGQEQAPLLGTSPPVSRTHDEGRPIGGPVKHGAGGSAHGSRPTVTVVVKWRGVRGHLDDRRVRRDKRCTMVNRRTCVAARNGRARGWRTCTCTALTATATAAGTPLRGRRVACGVWRVACGVRCAADASIRGRRRAGGEVPVCLREHRVAVLSSRSHLCTPSIGVGPGRGLCASHLVRLSLLRRKPTRDGHNLTICPAIDPPTHPPTHPHNRAPALQSRQEEEDLKSTLKGLSYLQPVYKKIDEEEKNIVKQKVNREKAAKDKVEFDRQATACWKFSLVFIPILVCASPSPFLSPRP